MVDAERHFRSAEAIADSDPSAAYAVMYDGARKALATILAQQGLRATSKGGHLAVQNAVEVQFGQASRSSARSAESAAAETTPSIRVWTIP